MLAVINTYISALVRKRRGETNLITFFFIKSGEI